MDQKQKEQIIYISVGVACLFFGVLLLMSNNSCKNSDSDNYKKERYEIIPKRSTQQGSVPSTFCNCGGGIIRSNCESPAKRVDAYHSGTTEQSKFQNKNWQSNPMPYDAFIQQPNYESQNTNWFDPMPYALNKN